MKTLSEFILRLWGWRITGADQVRPIPKKIIIVAPHTSNWDFPLGLLVRKASGIKSYYLGKKSLFDSPLGFIFRMLGGYPVDRSKHGNQVDAIVDLYNKHETFCVTMAPEGTRKKVEHFRTGFYFIAKKADIPIILTKFDAKEKLVTFSGPFYPTDDFETDIRYIERYFCHVEGIVPENSFTSPDC